MYVLVFSWRRVPNRIGSRSQPSLDKKATLLRIQNSFQRTWRSISSGAETAIGLAEIAHKLPLCDRVTAAAAAAATVMLGFSVPVENDDRCAPWWQFWNCFWLGGQRMRATLEPYSCYRWSYLIRNYRTLSYLCLKPGGFGGAEGSYSLFFYPERRTSSSSFCAVVQISVSLHSGGTPSGSG